VVGKLAQKRLVLTPTKKCWVKRRREGKQMLNQVILVGTITGFNNKGNTKRIIIAVPRSFLNSHGERETDFIKCQLPGCIAKNMIEHLKIGSMVGIRGRLSCLGKHLQVVTEKLTFLSQKRK
jgi:hypothetical protein